MSTSPPHLSLLQNYKTSHQFSQAPLCSVYKITGLVPFTRPWGISLVMIVAQYITQSIHICKDLESYSSCPLCKEEEESIVHFFLRCPITKIVWFLSEWPNEYQSLLNTLKMLKLTPLDAHNLLLMLQAASNAGFSSILLEEDLNVLLHSLQWMLIICSSCCKQLHHVRRGCSQCSKPEKLLYHPTPLVYSSDHR